MIGGSHHTCSDKSLQVRTIQSGGHAAEIIMDSGADGSVLPISYGHLGYSDNSDPNALQFVDAQGGTLGVRDVRVAEIQFGL